MNPIDGTLSESLIIVVTTIIRAAAIAINNTTEIEPTATIVSIPSWLLPLALQQWSQRLPLVLVSVMAAARSELTRAASIIQDAMLRRHRLQLDRLTRPMLWNGCRMIVPKMLYHWSLHLPVRRKSLPFERRIDFGAKSWIKKKYGADCVNRYTRYVGWRGNEWSCPLVRKLHLTHNTFISCIYNFLPVERRRRYPPFLEIILHFQYSKMGIAV